MLEISGAYRGIDADVIPSVDGRVPHTTGTCSRSRLHTMNSLTLSWYLPRDSRQIAKSGHFSKSRQKSPKVPKSQKRCPRTHFGTKSVPEPVFQKFAPRKKFAPPGEKFPPPDPESDPGTPDRLTSRMAFPRRERTRPVRAREVRARSEKISGPRTRKSDPRTPGPRTPRTPGPPDPRTPGPPPPGPQDPRTPDPPGPQDLQDPPGPRKRPKSGIFWPKTRPGVLY